MRTDMVKAPPHRASSDRVTPGAPLFAVFVFMLVATPKANIDVGPAPIYFIDFVILACFYYAMQARGRLWTATPLTPLLVVLAGFALLGEAAGVVYSGSLLQPAYMAVRTLLAFMVFVNAVQLVRTPADLELVLKAAAIGVLVTGALMVLSSLPQTRPVANLFFAVSFLEPAARSVAETFAEYGAYGVRGRTLVGVSILSATFVNAAWPLAALLLCWPRPVGVWRRVALAACFLAPFAVFMSYSRGPMLGSILIVLVALAFGLGRLQRGILRPILVGIGVVALVGAGSSVFMTDRLINRTQAVFDNPLADERESERVLAYIEPFEHVAEHPQFLFFGEGMGIQKTGRLFENANAADHALFAKAYYARGMVAAVLYHVLIVIAGLTALRALAASRGGLARGLAGAALLSLVALLPWMAFGHAMVSTPRGAMMLSFVLGLVAIAARVAAQSRSARPAVSSEVIHADRRHPAV